MKMGLRMKMLLILPKALNKLKKKQHRIIIAKIKIHQQMIRNSNDNLFNC